jgi:endo-1,3-1,4-beta-glycanase ExoK
MMLERQTVCWGNDVHELATSREAAWGEARPNSLRPRGAARAAPTRKGLERSGCKLIGVLAGRFASIFLGFTALVLSGCDQGGTTSLEPDASMAGVAGAQAGGAGATPGGSGGGMPAGGSAGSAAATGELELLFRDDFDTFDSTRWQLMTHSWAGNLSLFSTQAAKAEGGQLVLSLTPAPAGTVDDTGAAKSFLGAEVRSLDTLTYGRVRARVKFASGSAVVSSLVTIYTPWPADDWNELDIECLGATGKVQLNTMVYTGPPTTPPVAQSVKPTQFPHPLALDFDPSADFHEYELEWTPARARFAIDGQEVYVWNEHIDLMKLPQNVLMTIWASGSSGWAGPVTDATGTAKAYYDWIEVYTYALD